MTDTHAGPGSTSLEQSEKNIAQYLHEVIADAEQQAAEGCLQRSTTEDATKYIPKASTVMGFDADRAAETLSIKRLRDRSLQPWLDQLNDQKHQLGEGRREANKKFEDALYSLQGDEATRPYAEMAVKVINQVKEKLYSDIRNDMSVHVNVMPDGAQHTQAELRLNQAKLLLAQQIEEGTFVKSMQAAAHDHTRAVCDPYADVTR